MRAILLAIATLALTNGAFAAAPGPLPTWLRGEWTREWIQRGAAKTDTLDVHYLQTPTYFADIRIPRERSGLAAVKSFDELTDSQLALLATQIGLAGLTTLKGNIATWSDEVSFQPSDGSPDQGRLQRIPPDQMHEIGVDGSYTESWRHASGEKGPFLVIRVGHSGRLARTLVVIGDRFVYVRNRSKDLPRAPSLKALIEASHATREQVVQYLDCEFSAGRVHGGAVPWGIEQSTLPWREGQRLDFVDQLSLGTRGSLALRVAGDEQWAIPVNTLTRPEVEALLKAPTHRP